MLMVELAYTLVLETRYCKFESYLAHQYALIVKWLIHATFYRGVRVRLPVRVPTYVSVAQLEEQLVEAQRVICSIQIWYTNLSGYDVNGSIGVLGTSCVGSNPAIQTIYI